MCFLHGAFLQAGMSNKHLQKQDTSSDDGIDFSPTRMKY